MRTARIYVDFDLTDKQAVGWEAEGCKLCLSRNPMIVGLSLFDRKGEVTGGVLSKRKWDRGHKPEDVFAAIPIASHVIGDLRDLEKFNKEDRRGSQ